MLRQLMFFQHAAHVSLATAALLFMTSCGDGTPAGVPETVCNKLIGCKLAKDSEYDLCLSTIKPFMQYIIDANQVLSCINSMSCTQLKTGGAKVVQGCLDQDNSSFKCNGDTLHYCNNKGACKDVNCRTLCDDMGRKYQKCDSSISQGHAVCWCS